MLQAIGSEPMGTEDLDRLLAAREPWVAELIRGLCARIGQVLPDPVVTVEGGHLGFGHEAGYKGLVFTIIPAKAHVTLGISGGAALPDPAGLLEGTGKVHKHVKLRQLADLDRPELLELLRAAVTRKN